jgi:hypothetical protein
LDVHQRDDVVVLKKFKDLDLSKDPFSVDLVIKSFMYLFDSYFFISFFVICGTHDAISSLAQVLKRLISVVNQKDVIVTLELSLALYIARQNPWNM